MVRGQAGRSARDRSIGAPAGQEQLDHAIGQGVVERERVDTDGGGDVGRLVMRIRAGAGVYALVWAVILVLMITKP